jgi:hypothetical protein
MLCNLVIFTPSIILSYPPTVNNFNGFYYHIFIRAEILPFDMGLHSHGNSEMHPRN